MAQWFCEIMGEVVGPLKSTQLLDKVRTGEIVADTRIRKDDSQWVLAIEVGGLFDAATRAPKKRICPYCSHEVEQPPTTCNGCNRWINRALLVSVGGSADRPEGAPAAPAKTNGVPIVPQKKGGFLGAIKQLWEKSTTKWDE